jgi:predicted nuclease of predicted toxin-antitoxin system
MMVKFLADECFSGPLVRALREAGFDVVRSADQFPSAPDERVLAHAYEEGRILLTEDNDFGDLAVRLGLPTRGVVRVDLKPLNKSAQAARVVKALIDVADEIEGALVTIEKTRTRVRKLR